MIVVSDSSPLIALSAVGRFELLRDLYGEISIPETRRRVRETIRQKLQ